MPGPAYLTKGITIRGVDGNYVTVRETPERCEVVVAIQQNDDAGRLATVRLNADQFKALCRSQYELDVEPGTETNNKEEAI